jgi:alpha-beta hydrolase superfamily lysophospholipase
MTWLIMLLVSLRIKKNDICHLSSFSYLMVKLLGTFYYTHKLNQFDNLIKWRKTMKYQDGTFAGPRGIDIYHQSWSPEKDPRGVLIVVHGLAEHSGRYKNFVDYFVPRGYAIYSLDHIGHGKSGGERVFVERFVEFIEPLRILHQRIQDFYAGKPIFMVGHSLGGLITSLYLANYQDELSGSIISGPLTELPDYITPLTEFAANIFSFIMPKVGLVQIDAEGISRDPRVVQNYENDPLVYRGKNTARLGAETLSAMKYNAALAGKITLPVLILQGSADKLVNPQGSQNLYDLLGSEDKTLHYFDGLYHEIYNEPEQESVFHFVEEWLESHLTVKANDNPH